MVFFTVCAIVGLDILGQVSGYGAQTFTWPSSRWRSSAATCSAAACRQAVDVPLGAVGAPADT